MKIGAPAGYWIWFGGVAPLLLTISVTGCASLIDPNVPEPIRANVEPEFDREYLLYRPSSYNREQAWPLIVVCHSTFPDSANKRIRVWTQLAEQAGFLVVAPQLKGNRKEFLAGSARQIPLQHQDERHILAAIRHVCAAHTISQDRVFIHGFSGGTHAALHTGLKHPEIFRAISLAQPKFDQDYLANIAELVDPYQPVFVERSIADAVMGKHGRRCVEWLRARLENLREDTVGGTQEASTQQHVEFFEDVIRTIPWIRIRALPGPDNNVLSVQFSVQSSTKLRRYRWSFGDQAESTLTEPLHTFAEPGTFRITAAVEDAEGRTHHRSVNLAVPQIAIAHTPVSPGSSPQRH